MYKYAAMSEDSTVTVYKGHKNNHKLLTRGFDIWKERKKVLFCKKKEEQTGAL